MQANDGTVVPEPLRTHSALAMRHVAPTHQYSYQLKYHMLKPHATLGTKYIDFRDVAICGRMTCVVKESKVAATSLQATGGHEYCRYVKRSVFFTYRWETCCTKLKRCWETAVVLDEIQI